MMEKPKWFVNLPWVQAYLARVRDPIIADRSLDLMAAAFWGFLSAWGVSAAVTGLGTINEGLGKVYEVVWGGGIGIICTIAFYGAISTFLSNKNILVRIRRKKIEMLWGAVAGGFISVYPMLLLVAVIYGDLTRFAPMWAAATFLVVPTWRVRHLYHRIAKLRQIAADRANTAEVPVQKSEDDW